MSELQAALVGGLIGGLVGGISALIGSYFGPRRLEQWRARIKEERDDGPRKDLLREMLEDPVHRTRSLKRLTLVTGTTDEECRRLLIQVRARGVTMRDEHGVEQEGWALIERFGLNAALRVNVEDAPDA